MTTWQWWLTTLLRTTTMARLTRAYSSAIDVPPQAQMPDLKGYNVAEITIAELQDCYRHGHFSIEDFTTYCLERIRHLNPYLEAVIEVNPEAISIARSLDANLSALATSSSLYGVPVLVKDNMATKDLMQTTAGSWALLGSIVPRDAFIVQKLRQAGAIIVGHAGMSEYASLRSKVYSTGYSPRGGQVRNPFNLSKSPFGSSSGSAVCVSANIVPLSFGTETDSSIIGPAGANSVVGIKPTVGLTSRTGVFPISENMDTVGAFGRTVADAVAGLDAIVGTDPDDIFTSEADRVHNGSYAACLSGQEHLQSAIFGLPLKRCWELCPNDTKAIAIPVLEAIKQAGARVVEVSLPSIEERTNPDGIWDWELGTPETSEWTVVKVDAYNGINAYLNNLSDTSIKSVDDIVEFNKLNSGTEGAMPDVLPAFPSGQDNLLEVVRSKGDKNSTYYAALDHIHRQTRENGIDAAMQYTEPTTNKTQRLDALIFCDENGVGQQYAAQAGYPIIAIPIGVNARGMPVSLSFQSTAWTECSLIRWASAIEDLWKAKAGGRPTPGFQNLFSKNIPIADWS